MAVYTAASVSCVQQQAQLHGDRGTNTVRQGRYICSGFSLKSFQKKGIPLQIVKLGVINAGMTFFINNLTTKTSHSPSDFSERDGTGPVTMRLLDATGGGGALPGGLGGQLLPGSFTSGRLTGRLLGTSHFL